MATDDSFTKSILHFEGADSSTSFLDDSGKSWTANGNARIVTAQQKFGVSAGYFDGVGDYITTPDHAELEFGSNSYTIDFWMMSTYPPSVGNQVVLMGKGGTAASGTAQWSIYLHCGSVSTYELVMVVYFDGTTPTNGAGGGASNGESYVDSIFDGNWHHIAIVKNGSYARAYMDGQSFSQVQNSSPIYNSTGVLQIGKGAGMDNLGYGGTNSEYKGWIDEARISNGVARWTADFTPPTQPYPSPTTVLQAGIIM